jgi:hypothetical protein
MEGTMVKVLYLLLLLNACRMIKIFTFKYHADGALSYASYRSPALSDSAGQLPGSFAFCGSFKQTTLDGNSFFTFYGKDGNSWVVFSLWPASQEKAG